MKEPKLPLQAQIFIDHLTIGLDSFDLNFEDYGATYVNHKEYGVAIMFSQVKIAEHSESCRVKNSIIVSGLGVHFSKEQIFPFSNEQPPSHLAILILSAIVKDTPLQFICEECHGS